MSKPLKALLKTLAGPEKWSYVSDPPPPFLRRVRNGATGIDHEQEVPHIFSPGQEIRFELVSVIKFTNHPMHDEGYALYQEMTEPYTDWAEITKQLAENQAKQAADYATKKFKDKYQITADQEAEMAQLMTVIPPKDYEGMIQYLERIYLAYKWKPKMQFKGLADTGANAYAPLQVIQPSWWADPLPEQKPWKPKPWLGHTPVVGDSVTDWTAEEITAAGLAGNLDHCKKAPKKEEDSGVPGPVTPKRRLMRKGGP